MLRAQGFTVRLAGIVGRVRYQDFGLRSEGLGVRFWALRVFGLKVCLQGLRVRSQGVTGHHGTVKVHGAALRSQDFSHVPRVS